MFSFPHQVLSIAEDVLSHCPSGFTPDKVSQQDSGKLLVLGEMLKYLHSCQPKTKIVLISNYTQVTTKYVNTVDACTNTFVELCSVCA